MPTTLPSMNALNTQPYRERPPRSRATTGMTVTTASASDAMKVMVSTRPGGQRPPRGRPQAVRTGDRVRAGPAGCSVAVVRLMPGAYEFKCT